jgi:hypothetical protein
MGALHSTLTFQLLTGTSTSRRLRKSSSLWSEIVQNRELWRPGYTSHDDRRASTLAIDGNEL